MIEDKQLNFDFYFWLGEDGETRPVSEQEFLENQNRIRLDRDNFLNVRIPSSEGIDVVGD